MDEPVRKRLVELAVGAAGAALFGAVTLLAQLGTGTVDQRTARIAWAGFAIGCAWGAFAGFVWTGTAASLLSRFGISDPLAVAAGLGVLVMPLAPPIVSAVVKRLTRIISGPNP